MENLVEQLQKIPGFEIESPFVIKIGSVTYSFDCLIKGYGAEIGMIIDKHLHKVEPVADELWEMGYGFSCLDIFGITSPAEKFINNVLIGDWGKNDS